MNQNGYCPKCDENFDGEVIIDDYVGRGVSLEVAMVFAKQICGWDEYGEKNKWDNKLAIYCFDSDRTVRYKCKACEHEFKEERRYYEAK